MKLFETFYKLIDRYTLEEAPENLGNNFGFKFNKNECEKQGYKPLKLTPQTADRAYYVEKDNHILQQWEALSNDDIKAKRLEAYHAADYLFYEWQTLVASGAKAADVKVVRDAWLSEITKINEKYAI